MKAARLALASVLVLSGCGLGQGLYGVDLPGGADLGDHPYTVTAQFRDALDLVPQAGVKVNDVPVGRVSAITLEKNGRIAEVKVEINGNVRLPANAVAAIRQTSLLGEKYVALSAPLTVPAQGTLRNGATIAVTRTSTGVEVEQVFGALSLLLTGGGLGQLRDIYRELNAFAGGHEDGIRTFLANVTSTVRDLNTRKQAIIDALDALNTLAVTLKANTDRIATVLRSFAPGIAVLADQRKQLTSLLTSLDRLSTVTVSTLQQSKQNIVDDLTALAPVLTQLAAAGESLPRSLQILATYPFPDAAVAGIKGDYLNSWVRTALRTPGGTVVTASWPGSGSIKASAQSGPGLITPPPSLLPPTTSAAPGLPSTVVLTSPSALGSTSGSSSGSSTSGPSSSGPSSSPSAAPGTSTAPASGSTSPAPASRTSGTASAAASTSGSTSPSGGR